MTNDAPSEQSQTTVLAISLGCPIRPMGWADTSICSTSGVAEDVLKRLDRREVEEFLLACGTDRLAHPGGTLHEHLARVAALLAEWGAEEVLQYAGLCHACYGTDGYGEVLLSVASF